MMRRLLGTPSHTWRALMLTTLPRERALAQRMRAEFNRTGANAMGAVLNGHEVDSGLEAHYRHTLQILTSAYHEGMPLWGKMIIDGAKARRPARAKPFEPMVVDWIRKNSVLKVQQITKTSREQLRNIMSRGRQEGLGASAIASLIREDFDAIGRARSQTIARTETHSAANAAQWMAADSLGIPMQREWIAAEDERTRQDHSDANGQVVGMDEPFEVGGESLMQPGDPSGSPEQIINCRCATGFIVTE